MIETQNNMNNICTACGTENKALDSKFCIECGVVLYREEEGVQILTREGFEKYKEEVLRDYAEEGIPYEIRPYSPITGLDVRKGIKDKKEKPKRTNIFRGNEKAMDQLMPLINEILKSKDIDGTKIDNFKLKKIKQLRRGNPTNRVTIEFEIINTRLMTMWR